MKETKAGGRILAASILLCSSLFAATAAPSFGAQRTPVNPPDGGGGPSGPCQGCTQSATTAGTATDGSALNGSNSSQFKLTYTVPNDGTTYSGTLMTQVVNADGSVTVNTFSITDYGNGNSGAYATAFNNSTIPTGGSGSISINETNSAGTSLSAGWVVHHFGQ